MIIFNGTIKFEGKDYNVTIWGKQPSELFYRLQIGALQTVIERVDSQWTAKGVSEGLLAQITAKIKE